MKAFASSFGAWRSLEEQEGIRVPHGLVFPLAVLQAIGAPYGLVLEAEEETPAGPTDFDAVFVSVLDSRNMIDAAKHFDSWRMPLRSAERKISDWPLVWAGGQGLHNPVPFGPIADLVVIGDAEDPLPLLLESWGEHGNSRLFLARAADVPGVWVPSVHGHDTTIVQSVADDISVTLRNDISVSLDGTRRLEIARGCKYNCAFCSLGWRAPLRENTTADVIAEIHRSPKRVHLQAGDAESHSGIGEIRASLTEAGGFDSGWTGRLDSLLDNPDQSVPGSKRYAFGVEGVSYRLRHAVGKAYLTDDRLVDDTVRFLSMIDDSSVGRAAWHLMAGLPTEQPLEVLQLAGVVRRVDDELRTARSRRRNLSLHWQPFCPLPGTPMQWCATGSGARRMASTLGDLRRLSHIGVRHVTGRTDQMARLCTVLSRSDSRGADLIEALGAGSVTPEDAMSIAGVSWGELDPADPLPWDFVVAPRSRSMLERAHGVVMGRLNDNRG